MFSPVLERVQNNFAEHLLPNETKKRPIGLHCRNPSDFYTLHLFQKRIVTDRNHVGSNDDSLDSHLSINFNLVTCREGDILYTSATFHPFQQSLKYFF